MSTLVDAPLRAKIERRSRRAWRHRRGKSSRRIHRITQVTDKSLLYRIPEPGNYYGTKKLEVLREKGGKIVIKEPPEDPLLDLKSKFDLSKLKKHNGLVRAYKYTDKDGKSPIQTSNAIKYEVGKDYEIKDANTDPSSNCHTGVNIASLDWCKSSMYGEYRLFAVEFHSKDVAAIPTNSDGKFRVFRCKVVEELDPKDPAKVIDKIPAPPPQGTTTPRKLDMLLPPRKTLKTQEEIDEFVEDEQAKSAEVEISGEIEAEVSPETPAAPDEPEDAEALLEDTEGLLGRIVRFFRRGG
jgi:hypothetical protein